MPSYRGKFQYLAQNGTATQQGTCQIQFDDESFTLTPETGAALVFDLGDIDAPKAADYEIVVPLYTGCTLRLQQFGKSYENLARELLESYRKRTLQCLLLADLQEVDRFTGAFTLTAPTGQAVNGPAEVRLFKSNLAVLPTESQAFQWRLADLSAVRFDAQSYEVVLESRSARLSINRLAKRTEVFHSRLTEVVEALKAESAQALHAILPFLNPDELQATAAILREGHAVAESRLAAIHPRIPAALTANGIDKTLKPYYDDLLGRAAKGSVFAGFKLLRPEDRDLMQAIGEGASDDAGEAGDVTSEAMPDADPNAPPVLYWFFFPIAAEPGGTVPGKVVAWEASSLAGRATYFFRLLDAEEDGVSRDGANAAEAVEAAVERINRVLGMLNFRRRPIYLSENALSSNPVFHRYAIAARKIPDLRSVRAAFLGRAIHSSLEAWQGQVRSILESQRNQVRV